MTSGAGYLVAMRANDADTLITASHRTELRYIGMANHGGVMTCHPG